MLLIAGCREPVPDVADLPTRIPSGAAYATSQYLTQIAPPEGLRQGVSLPAIDEGLVFLPNWHIDASFRFDGVFSGTPREVSARTDIQVWFNQVGNERRVVIEGGGELLGEQDGSVPRREGVRLGGDTFLLIDGVCLGDADGDAATVADLRLSDVIGGVSFATPAGQTRTINGQEVWRYQFDPANMLLPLVQFSDPGQLSAVQGELWMTRLPPNQDVAVRYYVSMQVDNVVLRLFESSLPVSGQLLIRYDLLNVGQDPNITQPNGC